MAESASSNVVISIEVDGVPKLVAVDPNLLNSLSSEDVMIKQQAFEIIRQQLQMQDTAEAQKELEIQSTPVMQSSEPSEVSAKETEEHDNTTVFVWSEQDVKALFHIRVDMEEDFKKAKTHTTLWNRVQQMLATQGCTATSVQCMNKWKNLKKEFMKSVDNNNSSGRSPKTCKFYDEFSQLYGCKSSTKPEATMSSSRHSPGIVSPVKSSRKRKATESPLLAFVKEHSHQQEELNKARDEECKQRHAQKMEVMERFLGFFEKLVEQKK